ncbi:hypothetical protein [Paenibacillus polysaccharolyticus]|uniref:hypothetical protein n=1 Tax=Paenibacillus polysaccharolyticus TaxID=582692 RepID=UPI00300AC4A6
MENVIEKLRELIGDGYEGEAWDETHEDVSALLEIKRKEYTSVNVESTFEDGGRWTNYKTDVYRVTQDDGQVAYFQIGREVPATEMQEGGDFSVTIDEVVPKEVVKVEYVYGRSA